MLCNSEDQQQGDCTLFGARFRFIPEGQRRPQRVSGVAHSGEKTRAGESKCLESLEGLPGAFAWSRGACASLPAVEGPGEAAWSSQEWLRAFFLDVVHFEDMSAAKAKRASQAVGASTASFGGRSRCPKMTVLHAVGDVRVVA